MSRQTAARDLKRLAELYGIQTAYRDVHGQRQPASPEGLLAALRALGVTICDAGHATEVLRHCRQADWQRLVDPVAVAWLGDAAVRLNLKAGDRGALDCELRLESGEVRRWNTVAGRLPTDKSARIEGTAYSCRRLALPADMPRGYHQLLINTGGREADVLVICAPPKAFLPRAGERMWGLFAPVYALHSANSWGSGDFSDLAQLMSWTAGLGGGVVGTLPFLAAFLAEPCEPSPYSPVSRLFWNELYVDVTRAPELGGSAQAQALLDCAEVRRELNAVRRASQIDYRRIMALKRKVLQELAHGFFRGQSDRQTNFQRYLATQPKLGDYAAFRAAGERLGSMWQQWPEPQRHGILSAGDYDQETQRYHTYVQWLAHEQLEAAVAVGSASGAWPCLYLDLPIGVHPQSYDVWRERDAFAREVSAGAPPDLVFTQGQNWGFPPLHPLGIRQRGYPYFIACLRHQMRHAGLLRLDHVMGLHRLFWIPKGLEPRQGVYVRYPTEELYAVLSLESHRHQCGVAGENLGTVPAYVTGGMRRHSIEQLYVLEYELNGGNALRPVPAASVASLNTHDMHPFAAFWDGQDIEDRLAFGLLDRHAARAERKARGELRKALIAFLRQRRVLTGKPRDAATVLRACAAFLSQSAAHTALFTVEDLWQERRPQNIPNTGDARPNWRGRMRYGLEELQRRAEVIEFLRQQSVLRA